MPLNIVMKPHRSYLKSQTAEPQKLFVMLRLVPEREVAQTRPPLAVALVIDTSGSMRDEVDNTIKLERAIEAAHKLIDDPALEPQDKITVIHFDDESKVLLPLSPLQRGNAHEVVDTLRRYSGGTKMGKGMQNALDQLRQEPPDVAKRLILLTDGQTFDEELCRKLSHELAETNTPILSIGIGDEYNDELLSALSDATKGRWLHLTQMEQLDEFFTEEIGQAVREVVTDLQLKIAGVRGITLERISRAYPSIAEVPITGGQPFRLGNVQAGDYTIFILEFIVSGIARPPSRARLAQFTLWASVPGAKQRQVEFPPEDLFITFTPDDALVAQVDPEVLDYVQQMNVNNLITRASQLAAQGKAEEAHRTLQMAQGITQRLNNPGVTRLLQQASDELRQTGTISESTRRTLRAGSKTMAVKSGKTQPLDIGLSEEEIRKQTGT